MSGNKPLPYEKPPKDNGESPPTDIKDKLVAFAFDILSDAQIDKDYRVPTLFDGRKAGPGGRQTPTVKPPAESDLAVVHFQLPGLVYTPDGAYLMTLKGAPTGGPGSRPRPAGAAATARCRRCPTSGPAVSAPAGR